MTSAREVHRPAHGRAFDCHDAVAADHTDVEVRDRLVLTDTGHLDLTGDLIARTSGSKETPVGLKEHGAGSGKLLRDDGVEDRARHAALHHDLAQAGPAGRLGVVVERVAVTTHIGEADDVVRLYRAAHRGGVTHVWGAVGPGGHGAP